VAGDRVSAPCDGDDVLVRDTKTVLCNKTEVLKNQASFRFF